MRRARRIGRNGRAPVVDGPPIAEMIFHGHRNITGALRMPDRDRRRLTTAAERVAKVRLAQLRNGDADDLQIVGRRRPDNQAHGRQSE